jgi:hypothetical protein
MMQKKWTMEPELIIPPLKKCEIIEQTEHSVDKLKVEHITRDLISKRKSKDQTLREQVHYYPSSGLCVLVCVKV